MAQDRAGPAAVGVLPVVLSEDPWATPDVLALRVGGSALLARLVSRLDEAGVPVILAISGSARIAGSFVRVCRVADGYGAALHAAVDQVPDEAEVVLVHDPSTPLTPASEITRMVRDAQAGSPVVLTRGVAETVKTMVGGRVGQTVRRDLLESVHAPAAVPARQLRSLRERGCLRGLASFVEFVTLLRTEGEVTRRRAGVLSQNVTDERDIVVLECAAKTMTRQ